MADGGFSERVHTALHPGWPNHESPNHGGCHTCRFVGERFGRPFCDLHGIASSLPASGCASREREPGSDDAEFWRVKK